MRFTKKIITMATCAVMAASSMVGMSASVANVANISAQAAMTSSQTALLNTITGRTNTLFASSTFGRAISDTSSSWATDNNLSEIEIVARLIYGENTSDTYDQTAIAWVLINRKNSTEFPNTFEDVATQSNAFASITSSTPSNTNHARNPQKTEGWRNAIFLACCLDETTNTSDYMWLFGKPDGIDTQTFFTSYSWFYNHCTGSGSNFKYLMDGNYKNVEDVVVTNYMEDGFVKPATYLYSRADVSSYYQKFVGKKNIFFNLA